MKKSRAVPLILIGTLTLLSGCGESQEEVHAKQNRYASQSDCRKDWGSDDRDCRPGSGGGYVGPRYVYSHSGGYPMAIDPNGTTRQLSNSFLSHPGTASTAIGSNISPVVVSSNSSAASVGRAAGVSVARGGFGASAHGASTGG